VDRRTATKIVRGRPAGLRLSLAVLMLMIWSPASQAAVAAGNEVQLQFLTLTGSIGIRLTNPGKGSASTAEIVVGQAGPVGVSQSTRSGVQIEFGAIPARGRTVVPEPTGLALVMTVLATLGVMRSNRIRVRNQRGSWRYSAFSPRTRTSPCDRIEVKPCCH
jgi:hypothetical protein